MGIYGKYLNDTEDKIIKENSYNYDALVDFIEESDRQMELIFNHIISVNEAEETGLTVYDPEKIKKTFTEKLKEMVVRFKNFVIKLFKDLAEKLHKLYSETNLIDKYVSKFKDKVTYKNLMACKERGWKGIPKNVYMINKIVDATDTNLYKTFDGDVYQDERVEEDRDIEPIIKAVDLDEAKTKYKEFENKLNKFLENKRRDNASDINFANNLKASLDVTGSGLQKAFFVIGTGGGDDRHYYPPVQQFETTKKLAEEGESFIKQTSYTGKKLVANLKIDSKADLNNMKSYKGSKEENDKITVLYYKAKYKYQSAYISRSSQTVRAIVNMMRIQHQMAISFYIQCCLAINKFNVA